MWDFIKNILQAIWDTFSQLMITAFFMHCYNKKINNPDSIWYYKTIVTKIKIRAYAIKIILLLFLFNFLRVFGFKNSKEINQKLLVGMILVVLASVLLVAFSSNRKKEIN
jgi:hypothetical protein